MDVKETVPSAYEGSTTDRTPGRVRLDHEPFEVVPLHVLECLCERDGSRITLSDRYTEAQHHVALALFIEELVMVFGGGVGKRFEQPVPSIRDSIAEPRFRRCPQNAAPCAAPWGPPNHHLESLQPRRAQPTWLVHDASPPKVLATRRHRAPGYRCRRHLRLSTAIAPGDQRPFFVREQGLDDSRAEPGFELARNLEPTLRQTLVPLLYEVVTAARSRRKLAQDDPP